MTRRLPVVPALLLTLLGLTSLAETARAQTADLTVAATHLASFAQGQAGATYTITVTNVGTAATAGGVIVTDTLPVGLAATFMSGTGWTCTLAALTCSRSDALAPAASYPVINLTVTVAADAAASVTNSVTVSGGGQTNTANDTATDGTPVCRVAASSSLTMPVTTFLHSYRVAFRTPTRLAVDADDNVYIADPAAGELLVRARDGAVLAVRRDLGNPVSIAVDAAGRTYVGDGAAGRVRVFDAAGIPLFDLGAGDGEFGHPGSIAVDPGTGEVYVTDTARHAVRVFTAAGALARSWGGSGSSERNFQVPTGIAFDALRGQVLVMDQLNYSLKVYDPGGNFLFCIGTSKLLSGGFFNPATGPARTLAAGQGVRVDALGRIFVTDAFQGQVFVLDPVGKLLGTIGTFGDADGQLRVPTDLVIDRAGRLFVASSNNARVEIFGLDAYADAEATVPALVSLNPATIDVTAGDAVANVTVTLPGRDPARADGASIRVNGLPPSGTAIGDADGDGVPDLLLTLPASALAATFAPALSGTVTATGVIDGLTFTGRAELAVTRAALVDADGDGVPDPADACPATPAGATVNADGCSVLQLCPCAGPAPGSAWRDHGEFYDCRQNAIAGLMATGRYTTELGTLFIEGARSSHCGTPAAPPAAALRGSPAGASR